MVDAQVAQGVINLPLSIVFLRIARPFLFYFLLLGNKVFHFLFLVSLFLQYHFPLSQRVGPKLFIALNFFFVLLH